MLATEANPDAPLSAIDWLNEQPREEPVALPGSSLEAPVAGSAQTPSVDIAPLDGGPAVGVLPAALSGLPPTLWQGAGAGEVMAAFRALPAEALAPVSTLRMRLLLASAAPPGFGDGDAFLLDRVSVLRDLGAVSEAITLIEEAGSAPGAMSPALFAEYAELTLLAGVEDQACLRLASEPLLSDDLALRIFCLARGGDWNAAAVTLRSAQALGDVDATTSVLLEQFLEPELADGSPPELDTSQVTPLLFRLTEAVGTPFSPSDLSRDFAVTGLEPDKGWKAQLDAAERLARSGAVSSNQLFGLYTARVPAASGGAWDRASAVQALDAALRAEEPRQISRALAGASEAMAAAGLERALAEMFSDRLAEPSIGEEGAERLLLLSSRYEEAQTAEPLARALAQGIVSLGTPTSTPLEDALKRGFLVQAPLDAGALGTRILNALADIEAARSGDFVGLPNALATLQAVGLESAARRAALALLLT